MKKRFIIGSLIFTLLFVLVVFVSKGGFSAGKKVMGKLENNDYKIMHRFSSGSNTYDRKGKCYDSYSGDEEECTREVGTGYEYGSIIVEKDNVPNFIISVKEDYYSLIDLEYFPYYHINGGQKNLVGVAYLSESKSYCSYVLIGEDKEGNNSCPEAYEEEIKEVISDMGIELSELGMTFNDMFSFGKYYYNKYMKPQISEINYKIKSDILPISEVGKYLRNNKYETTIGFDDVYKVISISNYTDSLNYFIKDNTVDVIYYLYEDVALLIYPEDDNVAGTSKDLTTCIYSVKIDGAEVEKVVPGSTCSEKEIAQIREAEESYNKILSSLHLKQQEMINYALAYE